MYNTNIRLRLHLHEVIVPIGTARLAPPSLVDKLLHSEEDEDTSGTVDTDAKQRQAALTISFRWRKVLLLVKSATTDFTESNTLLDRKDIVNAACL